MFASATRVIIWVLDKPWKSCRLNTYIRSLPADRLSPNEWAEQGKPVIAGDRQWRKENEILSNYHPKHISDEIDLQIREQFPIFLSREAMGRD